MRYLPETNLFDYKYISEESEFMDWNLTPIMKDKEAVTGLSYILKYKKN